MTDPAMKNVWSTLFEAMDSEASVVQVIQKLKNDHPDLSGKIDDAVSDVAHFLVDHPDPETQAMAVEITDNKRGTPQQRALLEKYAGNLLGVQLAGTNGQFVFFSEDVSSDAPYRVTYFDNRGFFGHMTGTSYEQLLGTVFKEGFRAEVTGVLSQMSKTQSFIEGNRNVAVLHQWQREAVMSPENRMVAYREGDPPELDQAMGMQHG